MSSYPVSPDAAAVSAGMVVAVPARLLASPLRNGRDLGEADRSALVVGGTERIRTGGATVFLKVVAVTEAVVTRDGQVRAEGRPYDHATLGPLEDWLEAQAGPGVIDGIADRAVLGSHGQALGQALEASPKGEALAARRRTWPQANGRWRWRWSDECLQHTD